MSARARAAAITVGLVAPPRDGVGQHAGGSDLANKDGRPDLCDGWIDPPDDLFLPGLMRYRHEGLRECTRLPRKA